MNVELSGWLQCKNNVEADGGDGVFGGGGGEPRDFSPRKKKKKEWARKWDEHTSFWHSEELQLSRVSEGWEWYERLT